MGFRCGPGLKGRVVLDCVLGRVQVLVRGGDASKQDAGASVSVVRSR